MYLIDCQSCRARIPEEKVENALHPFSVEAFLASGEFTDFEFVVRPEDDPDVPERKFRAHKLFLAMRNEVFCAMFYGDLAEKDQVVITDCYPDGFDILLRFFSDCFLYWWGSRRRYAAHRYRAVRLLASIPSSLQVCQGSKKRPYSKISTTAFPAAPLLRRRKRQKHRQLHRRTV
ncbi:hypothetical protein V5799_008728 [Amblyomma americanum]|uniref:BTB domain-containing protein n=1 Tax=Amblyomma americanum TaxID=6943 RepID=A0AAQ4FCG3_AMBAM